MSKLRVSILVLSDKGVQGLREDTSGPTLADWLTARGAEVVERSMLPDERDQIAAWLRERCDNETCDLALTCGGTGVSPRDVTPEATRDIIDFELPGFGEAMRTFSLRFSAHAIISRALAGARRGTLVVNLPGSPNAAVENLEAVWEAIPHAVAKLQGDPSDCGTS